MTDILGRAIKDHFSGNQKSKLFINNSYDVPEEMPVEVYFRSFDQFTEMELKALNSCEGSILDVGAAAGDKALYLQQENKNVLALDISSGCVEVMKERGVKNILLEDFYKHQSKYDTLLFMMNGLGLAGTLNEIPIFLDHCKKLLNPGGKILFDSSDVKYLYEENPHFEVPYPYYGDIRYQYEYAGETGEWFNWVYADKDMLEAIVLDNGLNLEVLMEDEYDQYLGVISGF